MPAIPHMTMPDMTMPRTAVAFEPALSFDFSEAQSQGHEVWTALAPLMDRIMADGRAEPDRGFLSKGC